MSYVRKFYPESTLLGYTHVDGTMAFYDIVNSLLDTINEENKIVLDLGCGRGAFYEEEGKAADKHRQLRNFKDRVHKVIGLDVDKAASVNPTIDEFHLIVPNKPLPLPDNSVHLCICDFVIEHIDNPDFFFSELSRVVKKGGFICMRTSNKLGYVALAARMIPNKLHAKVLSKVQTGREEEDVFPTVYAINTPRKIRKYMKKYQFNDTVYTYEGEPCYLSFPTFSMLLGSYIRKWPLLL